MTRKHRSYRRACQNFNILERGLFATVETAGKLGRVNFLKDFWDRY